MERKSKITFEAPADVRRLMDEHPEVNWSEVLREAVRRHARAAAIAREIEEEMSDPRVQAVAAKLKRGVAARLAQGRHARRR